MKRKVVSLFTVVVTVLSVILATSGAANAKSWREGGYNEYGTYFVCRANGYLHVKVTKAHRTSRVKGMYVKFYFSPAGQISRLRAQVPLRSGSPTFYKTRIRNTGYSLDLGRPAALGETSFNSTTISYNVPRC